MCNYPPTHIPGNCPPPPFKGLEVEQYTPEQVAALRTRMDAWPSNSSKRPSVDPRPLLVILDALQARLAAAEAAVAVRDARIATVKAERNEWKDIASVFLVATEPDQPIPVQGQIMLAQVRERARSTFDTTLRGDASAKEAPHA